MAWAWQGVLDMGMISQVKSRLELQMVYDKLYTTRTKKPPLKALILLSNELPEALPNLVSARKKLRKLYRVKVEPLRDGLFIARIEKQVWGRQVSGNVIIDSETSGSWIAYTDESGYFAKRVVQPLFGSLYPEVLRLYFNYVQILDFLEHIKETYPGSSIVTHVAYKRQPRARREQPRGTRLLWEPGAEEDLRKDAARYRIWIDSLAFEVKDPAGLILLEASLTGTGIARLRFGTFLDFHHNVVQLYLGLATRWRNFFSDRERRIEEGKVRLRPYQLRYGFELQKPQIQELVTKLRTSYSHSVVFGGNPYLAVNLTDYEDGSSFYLTVLGSKVTITPMLKSTPYALWRIAGRVQRVVGEGEIRDLVRGRGA